MVYRSGRGRADQDTDFGIATLREDRGRPLVCTDQDRSNTGLLRPEQCLGRPVGPASDRML